MPVCHCDRSLPIKVVTLPSRRSIPSRNGAETHPDHSHLTDLRFQVRRFCSEVSGLEFGIGRFALLAGRPCKLRSSTRCSSGRYGFSELCCRLRPVRKEKA